MLNLQNAAEAVAHGVEAEYTWLATEQLTITGGVTYLDSTYEDFATAPGPVLAPNGTIQDLKDEPTVNAPKWAVNGLVQYVQPILNSRFDLTGRVDYQFKTEYNSGLENESFFRTDDTFFVNLSLELASPEHGWSIQAWGQNLTNELEIFDSATTLGGAPFPFNATQGLSPVVVVNSPRTWGVTLDYEF